MRTEPYLLGDPSPQDSAGSRPWGRSEAGSEGYSDSSYPQPNRCQRRQAMLTTSHTQCPSILSILLNCTCTHRGRDRTGSVLNQIVLPLVNTTGTQNRNKSQVKENTIHHMSYTPTFMAWDFAKYMCLWGNHPPPPIMWWGQSARFLYTSWELKIAIEWSHRKACPGARWDFPVVILTRAMLWVHRAC